MEQLKNFNSYVTEHVALATWLAAIAALFALAVLVRTLVVTRKAVIIAEKTFITTREIGEAQVRGYPSLSDAQLIVQNSRFIFKTHLINTGLSPLYDVRLSVSVKTQGIDKKFAEQTVFIGMIASGAKSNLINLFFDAHIGNPKDNPDTCIFADCVMIFRDVFKVIRTESLSLRSSNFEMHGVGYVSDLEACLNSPE